MNDVTVRAERIERFRTEAAALGATPVGSSDRDRLWLAVGLVAMVVGVVVGLVAYQSSLSADDPRDIQSSQILAIAMLGLVVAGAAVFLRYSLGRFLRFWLLRQLYEGQAHVDEVVAAVRGTGSGGEVNGSRPQP